MFIATEIQLPLGRSVIFSNGKNVSIASPEYIRIRWRLLQNLFIVLQNLKLMLYELCKNGQVESNQWLWA